MCEQKTVKRIKFLMDNLPSITACLSKLVQCISSWQTKVMSGMWNFKIWFFYSFRSAPFNYSRKQRVILSLVKELNLSKQKMSHSQNKDVHWMMLNYQTTQTLVSKKLTHYWSIVLHVSSDHTHSNSKSQRNQSKMFNVH